jgi:membrane protease YdiL (CAAX protease family)
VTQEVLAVDDATVTWRLRWAIALVVGISVLNLLVGRIVRAVAGSTLSSAIVSAALLATFATLYAVQLGAVSAGFRRIGGRMRDALGLARELPASWIGIAALAAVAVRALAVAYAAVMLSVGWRLQGWNTDPTRYFPRTLLGSLVLVFVVVVAAPVAEEIVFRGVLLTSLVPHVGEFWAIAITSAIFAALHLNLFSFLPIFAVAWVLSKLYLRPGSLWASIAGHATFNALGIVFVLLLRWKAGA